MSQSDALNSTPSPPPPEGPPSSSTDVARDLPRPATRPVEPQNSLGVDLRFTISERVLIGLFTAITAIHGATVVL